MSTERALEARARVHAALGDPSRLAMVDQLVLGDLSPGELAERIYLPSNLLAHHLKTLERAGVIERLRSEGDRRRTYVRLIPGAVSGLLPPHVDDVVRPDDLVVAVCDNAHEELGSRAPDRLHWSVPDPVRIGTQAAFEQAFALIGSRVDRLAVAVNCPEERP